MKRIIILAALFALGATLRAQPAMPALTARDLPGWTAGTSESYSDKELYGYIDGGAELYREYGFERLAVQHFTRGKDELQIEVYRMKSADAAFGIWSLSHAPFDIMDTGKGWSRASNGQLVMARGNCYISITAKCEKKDEAQLLNTAAKALSKAIRERDAQLPAVFSRPLLRPLQRNVRLMRGPLGLQNGASDWAEPLEGIAINALYLVPIELGPDTHTFAQIVFAKPDGCTEFLNRIKCPSPLKPSAQWTKIPGTKYTRGVRLSKDGTLQLFESVPSSFDILLQILERE